MNLGLFVKNVGRYVFVTAAWGDTLGNKGFEFSNLEIPENLKEHMCPGLYTCSGKTHQVPKLSPLADSEALHKQEVKAKAVL